METMAASGIKCAKLHGQGWPKFIGKEATVRTSGIHQVEWNSPYMVLLYPKFLSPTIQTIIFVLLTVQTYCSVYIERAKRIKEKTEGEKNYSPLYRITEWNIWKCISLSIKRKKKCISFKNIHYTSVPFHFHDKLNRNLRFLPFFFYFLASSKI